MSEKRYPRFDDIGTPQAPLATLGTGAWISAVIPIGTNHIDFLLDSQAYVVVTDQNVDPFLVNNGIPYPPNLPLRLPCRGAGFLHLKGDSADIHILKWNAIA
jgi:hypothetical protein